MTVHRCWTEPVRAVAGPVRRVKRELARAFAHTHTRALASCVHIRAAVEGKIHRYYNVERSELRQKPRVYVLYMWSSSLRVCAYVCLFVCVCVRFGVNGTVKRDSGRESVNGGGGGSSSGRGNDEWMNDGDGDRDEWTNITMNETKDALSCSGRGHVQPRPPPSCVFFGEINYNNDIIITI